MRDITTQNVREFMSKKLEYFSARTVQMLHGFLKASLQQAVDDAVIFRTPAGPIKRPSSDEKKYKYLSSNTVRNLIDKSRGIYKTLILLFWTSGLRREEILGLCWNDFKSGSITVSHTVKKGGILSTKLKTPSAYRTIPLPQETVQALIELQAKRPKAVDLTKPNLIFYLNYGKAIEPIVVTRYFSRLSENAMFRQHSTIFATLTPPILRLPKSILQEPNTFLSTQGPR